MNFKPWFLACFLLVSWVTGAAQRVDGIYHIVCMVQTKSIDGKQVSDCSAHPGESGPIGIGGRIGFDVATTHELMDQEGAPEVTDLILFVDGQPLPGTYPIVESQRDEPLPSGASEEQTDSVVTFRLVFPIKRDLTSEKGKQSWKSLLGGLGRNRKEVPVSVGLLNGPPLPSTYKAEFVRIGGAGLAWFVVIAIVTGIAFLLVATKTGALRDKEPSPMDAAGKSLISDPAERAYSLSRTQIALWTLLVVYAYLFIWFITGEYNTEVPRTILAILGIAAGTYGVAAAIDKDKADKGATVAKTDNFVTDVFSTSGGAALNRVQFGLWSGVLMIVFVATVYNTLAMPQLDSSLLGLMGISSAAYAGLKIPEQK